MKIQGMIFDFDGTLFDTMSIWETAGADYLKSIGYTAEKDLCQKLSAMSLLQSAEYLKKQYALPISTEDIINGINKTIESFYFYSAMPKENVTKYLSSLKSKGIKMCIATATDRYLAEAALKRCGMLGFFEDIFTCQEIGYGKDTPYIYEYACNHLHIEKSAVVIFEDACHSVRAAKSADFFVVGIYDKYESRTDEVREIADRYYMNFAEILKRGELF
ncbi:MAG: HAD family phosphatase [Clostridia bacterium]|nr:HAD family phosphatase [Clostridia bacterium]